MSVRPWALLLGLAACTPGQAPPSLTGMPPGWGFHGEDTPAQIVGVNLYPAVSVGNGGELDWDRGFRASLEGPEHVTLSGLAALDYNTLSGTVPGDIPVGVYDLELETPSGELLQLADAWRATETRADHLQVSVETTEVDIGQYAVLDVRVFDTDNQLVQTPLPIEVTLVMDGDATLSLGEDPALDSQTLDEATGVMTGSLSAGGIGSFAVSADDTSQVAVLVSPSEEGSVVAGDMVLLDFKPGPVASVEVELQDDLEGLRAGDAIEVSLRLLDESGHLTSGTQAVLYIRESCPGGDLNDTVYVLDELEDQTVTVTAATNLDCEENSLIVSGVASGTTFEGESEPFQVAPGPADHLDLVATPSEVQAGRDPLTVWVWVEDAWDNVVEDHSASLSLEDSVGGLDPDIEVGEQSCQPFTTGPALTFCEVWLWRTGDAVTITGRDTEGNTGRSNSVLVTAGDLAQIDLSIGATAVVAGEPLEVTIAGKDVLGNILDLDPSVYGNLSFRDDHGSLDCDRDRLESDGVIYRCVMEVADTGDHITVTLTTPDLEVADTTEPFAVINGPLDKVVVALGDISVVAGGDLAVSISGEDAFGNPYIVGGDREVELTDQTGTMALTGGSSTLTLDLAGEASTSATFTTAMEDNTIIASADGDEIGESLTFDVESGPLDGFSVQPEATFVWLGEALAVTVRAEDTYGNPVKSYDEPAELRSYMSLAPAATISSWTNGVAQVSFVYEREGLGDTLDLWVDGAREARSTSVDSLLDDCAAGPTAGLTVAGDAPTTLCLSGGSTPTTTVSAASSAEGDAALGAFHFDMGDGDWQRSTSDELSSAWQDAGAVRVRLVVADDDACGDEVDTVVYIAAPDGQPAGPVTLTPDDDTLNAGADSATVLINAVDCSGDPAEGQLLVWADLGSVEEGSCALTSSGAGLVVDISDGVGEVIWSMEDDEFSGEATIHAGTASGSAYGAATATVSGETARPLVLEVDPAGTTSDAFDSITVRFSEPIPQRYLTGGTVVLVERPSEDVPLADPTMSDDDNVATFPLESAAIPGTFVLTLSTDVRDRAGNKLNGGWHADGSASNFTLSFGAVVDSAPNVSGCNGTPSTFRPDGDGDATTVTSSEELDVFSIDAIADDIPEWWALRVYDADGALVRTVRVAADSTRDPLTWNGRDQNGFIVDNGVYPVTVTAEDEYWNSGTSCSTTAIVDNRVVGPP